MRYVLRVDQGAQLLAQSVALGQFPCDPGTVVQRLMVSNVVSNVAECSSGCVEAGGRQWGGHSGIAAVALQRGTRQSRTPTTPIPSQDAWTR